MMKNKLEDLNNHLFEQLERLNDEDLTGDALLSEIDRAKAITGVSTQIINNASLALKAAELMVEYGGGRQTLKLPELLTGKNDAQHYH
jgi:hypothetical protein